MNIQVRQQPQRITTAEFLAWYEKQPDGQRYELVSGVVVAMAPERISHNETKMAAWLAFRAAINTAGLPCRAFIDGLGVAVDDEHWRIPDLVVQCIPVIDRTHTKLHAPMIVVEILSPSSVSTDTVKKLVEYFSIETVQHYLIIDEDGRTVVHHKRALAGVLATRIVTSGPIELEPPGFTVAFEDLFAVV